MILYLALMATLAAGSSCVRCYLAWIEHQARVTTVALRDHDTFLTVA
jgi:hypothetical protein